MMSGCFYLGPLPRLAENDPPTLQAQPEEGSEVELGAQPVVFYVSGEDADAGTVLSFTWYLDGDLFGGAVTSGDVSFTSLTNSRPELDGAQLNCEVSDGENTVSTRPWTLRVLP